MIRPNYLFTAKRFRRPSRQGLRSHLGRNRRPVLPEGGKAGIDPYQIRVACETLATTNRIVIAGEVRGPSIDPSLIEATARAAVRDIGYEQDGFHWEKARVEVLLHAQSADIAQGVDCASTTRTRGLETRASCSATPAVRRRS